jgi:hypothetical protein
MRIAFVGYRDYGDGDKQYEKVDFVERENIHIVQTKVTPIASSYFFNILSILVF